MPSIPQAETPALPGIPAIPDPALPLRRLRSPFRVRSRCLAIATALAASLSLLTGCGTPGAPQPPSLKLPEPVTDLAATRSGNSVSLRWTMPRKTTDHLLIASQIKGSIAVEICRRESVPAPCQPSGHASFAPGAEAQFEDQLPAGLTSGSPRQLLYYVQIPNHSGHSAGLSNPALVPAGQVPDPIANLTAEVTAAGVVLQWASLPGTSAPAPPLVRLHRTRINTPVRTIPTSQANPPAGPPQSAKKQLAPAAEIAERDLLVHLGSASTAIDTSVRTGDIYEYTAQRLAQLSVSGQSLELLGQPSTPVRVEVIDNFPPAIPAGLVAVYTPAGDSSGSPSPSPVGNPALNPPPDQARPTSAPAATIDLSWQPDTEEDLAGYIVYRAIDSPSGNPGPFTRISGPRPFSESAFRDADIHPGQAYSYAVSAIDRTGHESDRSAPAQESVPANP